VHIWYFSRPCNVTLLKASKYLTQSSLRTHCKRLLRDIMRGPCGGIMRGSMRACVRSCAGDAWGRPGPLLAPRAATFLSASASERRSSRGWIMRGLCAPAFLLCAGLCAGLCAWVFDPARGDAWGRPGPSAHPPDPERPLPPLLLGASVPERRSWRGRIMRGLCAPAFLLCAGLCAGLCARVFDPARGDARGRPGPLRAPAPPEAATSAAAPERLGAGAAMLEGADYARIMRACVFIMRGTMRAGV